MTPAPEHMTTGIQEREKIKLENVHWRDVFLITAKNLVTASDLQRLLYLKRLLLCNDEANEFCY